MRGPPPDAIALEDPRPDTSSNDLLTPQSLLTLLAWRQYFSSGAKGTGGFIPVLGSDGKLPELPPTDPPDEPEEPGDPQVPIGAMPSDGSVPFQPTYLPPIRVGSMYVLDFEALNRMLDLYLENVESENASWGTPGNLPDAEVGVPYSYKPATITGVGPFLPSLESGPTLAQLSAAGFSLRTEPSSTPADDAWIYGTPLPGSEGTLGNPIELGMLGASGILVKHVFQSGILVRRKPSLEAVTIPTIDESVGSFSFASYLRGNPAAHITLSAGQTLPDGFVLTGDELHWDNVTATLNGAYPVTFDVGNGYHATAQVTLTITVAITIALDTVTRYNRTDTADPVTIVHDAAASGIKGAIMFALNSTITPRVSGLFYGGVALTKLPAAIGSAEAIEAGFVGVGVPQGPQSAMFDLSSATTDDMELLVLTVTSIDDLQVNDSDVLGGTGANSSILLSSGGKLCQAYALIGCAVADVGQLTNGAGLETVYEVDQGSTIWRLVRQATPSADDFTVGFSHSSCARVMSALNVRIADVVIPPVKVASITEAHNLAKVWIDPRKAFATYGPSIMQQTSSFYNNNTRYLKLLSEPGVPARDKSGNIITGQYALKRSSANGKAWFDLRVSLDWLSFDASTYRAEFGDVSGTVINAGGVYWDCLAMKFDADCFDHGGDDTDICDLHSRNYGALATPGANLSGGISNGMFIGQSGTNNDRMRWRNRYDPGYPPYTAQASEYTPQLLADGEFGPGQWVYIVRNYCIHWDSSANPAPFNKVWIAIDDGPQRLVASRVGINGIHLLDTWLDPKSGLYRWSTNFGSKRTRTAQHKGYYAFMHGAATGNNAEINEVNLLAFMREI